MTTDTTDHLIKIDKNTSSVRQLLANEAITFELANYKKGHTHKGGQLPLDDQHYCASTVKGENVFYPVGAVIHDGNHTGNGLRCDVAVARFDDGHSESWGKAGWRWDPGAYPYELPPQRPPVIKGSEP